MVASTVIFSASVVFTEEQKLIFGFHSNPVAV